MNQYRQEFKNAEDNNKLYHTYDKIREILSFVDDSLKIICTDVQEPVILTSYDIKSKIAKYTESLEHAKKHKKSPKINYSVLEALGLGNL
jgi:hypothetical protein